MLHHSEVAKHADASSLWLIVKGQAYDLTEVSLAPPRPPRAAGGQPARAQSR